MDVTDKVVAWLRCRVRGISEVEATPCAPGRRVIVVSTVDKPSFNQAVQEVFAVWTKPAHAMRMFEDIMVPPPLPTHPLANAFQRPYVGVDALAQLKRFLTASWTLCCEKPLMYKFPYSSLQQSSGFGKSRLMYELACDTKATTGDQATMKVLYTCLPSVHESAKLQYPQPTTMVADYFFGKGMTKTEMEMKLCQLFDYAMNNWDNVGSQSVGLFTSGVADIELTTALDNHRSHEVFSRDVGQHVKPHNERMLVFVVDNARSLLDIDANCNPCALQSPPWSRFHLFREALASACERNRSVYGWYAGVFAVFVDSTFPVEPHFHPTDLRFVPPFVLTHTMDAVYNDPPEEMIKSTRRVSAGSVFRPEPQMGRPLWSMLEPCRAVKCASEKLLGGWNPWKYDSYRPESLYGVASVMCRVGLRATPSSRLTSQLVDGYLAVLMHVDVENGRWIATYASEPVLMNSAARLWYAAATDDDHHFVLHQKMLPHLQTLIRHEAIDTGDLDVLVARIILLLAMDIVGFFTSTFLVRAVRQYAGEFRSMWDFLTVLRGDSNHDADSLTNDAMEKLQTQWTKWSLGFSHFVELSKEPDEECLRSMLQRRAAGVLPRGFGGGADLLIPMFHDEEDSVGCFPERVSAILVQTKAARTSMLPGDILSAQWATSLQAHEVIRVSMSLDETDWRGFVSDPVKKEADGLKCEPSKPTPPCVLHFGGLGPSNVTRADGESVVFLSEEVSRHLKRLKEPRHHPSQHVKPDINAATNQSLGACDQTTKRVKAELELDPLAQGTGLIGGKRKRAAADTTAGERRPMTRHPRTEVVV